MKSLYWFWDLLFSFTRTDQPQTTRVSFPFLLFIRVVCVAFLSYVHFFLVFYSRREPRGYAFCFCTFFFISTHFWYSQRYPVSSIPPRVVRCSILMEKLPNIFENLFINVDRSIQTTRPNNLNRFFRKAVSDLPDPCTTLHCAPFDTRLRFL